VKPTVKVIVTGPSETDGLQFVGALSEIEITQHEKKAPNPFSATKEEAQLWAHVGRVEWESMVIQMQALTAYKRYDFTWPTLLQEVYGVIVLVDVQDEQEMREVRRLLRLFGVMDYSNCLVAVKQAAGDRKRKLQEAQKRLETGYPLESYVPADRDSAEHVLRAWVQIVPPPEEPTRRRARSSGGHKGEHQASE